jgi:hypothetical protein
MTSASCKAVSYFREIFPELVSVPDDVLVSRIERVWEVEANIRDIEWEAYREATKRDALRDGESGTV